MLSPDAWQAVQASGNQMPDYYGMRIIAVTMKLKDCKGKEIRVRLVSAYAPHSGSTDAEKDQYEVDLDLAIFLVRPLILCTRYYTLRLLKNISQDHVCVRWTTFQNVASFFPSRIPIISTSDWTTKRRLLLQTKEQGH